MHDVAYSIPGYPTHPGFLATLSCYTCHVPATGALVFDKLIYDVGSNYNVSSGEFRVPATGRYLVSVRLHGGKSKATFQLVVDDQERMWTKEEDTNDSDKEINSQVIVVLMFRKDQLLYIKPGYFNTQDDRENTLYGSAYDPPSMRSWFSVTLLTTAV